LGIGNNEVHGTGKLMKKAIIGSSMLGMLSLLMLSASLFSTFVLAAPAPQFGRSSKQDKTRLLTGKVLDGGDNPLPNAVVYLTNTHTRSVKTYIVGPDGAYRFPALQPSIDYEVYAQYNNRKSGTKTVSEFDDRSQVYISLKVDTKADAK
jgi:Carboxypeptidase regulatory-like domain